MGLGSILNSIGNKIDKVTDSIVAEVRGSTKDNKHKYTTDYNYNEHIPPPCEYYDTTQPGRCCKVPGPTCKECDNEAVADGECIYSLESLKSEKMIKDQIQYDSKSFKKLMKDRIKNKKELEKNYFWVMDRIKQLKKDKPPAYQSQIDDLYNTARGNSPGNIFDTPLWQDREVTKWFGNLLKTADGILKYKEIAIGDASTVRLGSRYFTPNGMSCEDENGKSAKAYNYIDNIAPNNQSLATSMLEDISALNLDYLINAKNAKIGGSDGLPRCEKVTKPVGIYVKDPKNPENCPEENSDGVIVGKNKCIQMTRNTIPNVSIIEGFKNKNKKTNKDNKDKDKDKDNKICNCNFRLYGFFIILFILLLILNFFVF
jgi:hypothetical protein